MNDPQLVQKIVKGCCHFHLVDLSCTHSSMDYVKHRALREYMINQQDENDNHPLHVAASIGDDEMLNALLESLPGVLKELPNKEGLTFYGVAKARKQHEDKEKRENRDCKLMKTTNEVQSSFIVVATLITTVTFTTAFSLPGGVNQEEPIKGMAVLVAKTDFDVFLMCDSLAMCSSIVGIALLILLPGMRIGCIFIFLRLAAIECLKVSSFYNLLAFQKGVVLVVDFQHYKLPGFAVSAVIILTGIGVLILMFVFRRLVWESWDIMREAGCGCKRPYTWLKMVWLICEV